jgi:hypothetical protein
MGRVTLKKSTFCSANSLVTVKSYMTSANTEDDRETKKENTLHTIYTDVLQMLNIYVIPGQARQYGPDPSASRVFLRNLTIEVILPLNLASTPALVRSRHGRHYL